MKLDRMLLMSLQRLIGLVFLSAILFAQRGVDSRLARIEENTSSLKESVQKTDERVESIQKDLRVLQDKVVSVESQNKIIIGIAGTAFTLGLGFLIWLWKRFEAMFQKQVEGIFQKQAEAAARSQSEFAFTKDDRELLMKIGQKVSERGRTAGF